MPTARGWALLRPKNIVTMQCDVAMLPRQGRPSRIDVHATPPQLRECELPRRPRPGVEGTAGQAPRRVADEAIQIHLRRRSQPLTTRAGPDGRGGAQEPRTEFGKIELAVHAARAGAPGADRVVQDRDEGALTGGQGHRDCLLYAVTLVGCPLHPVDHHVEVVGHARVEAGNLVEGVLYAVHAHAREALSTEFREQRREAPRTAACQRRAEDHPRAFGDAAELSQDGIHAAGRDVGIATRAVLMTRAGPEHAQQILHLREAPHRRARVRRTVPALRDPETRRQPRQEVEGGLPRRAEVGPRRARQRLDETSLALGVERVEGERTLSAARGTTKHEEAFPREVEIDALEIVLACATNGDLHGAP